MTSLYKKILSNEKSYTNKKCRRIIYIVYQLNIKFCGIVLAELYLYNILQLELNKFRIWDLPFHKDT